MNEIDTVVIGAGHAGLAVSRLLTDARHEHVVFDRGVVAERWRTERWDSLRLLTPNWMIRLPGDRYAGREPDGFLSAAGLVEHLERYAASFDAPVQHHRAVRDLTTDRVSGGYRLVTDDGTWRARRVVIATGPHGVPRIPAGLSAELVLTSDRYRSPAQLRPGGVLVIGASSSGVQIADELVRAGRRVVLSVGRHTRVPRTYRGRDIFWWLACTGRLARTIDQVHDVAVARHEPSMQLVGRASPGEGSDVDLRALQSRGVRLVGRFEGVSDGRARFRPDLAENVATAERRMHRLLDAIDDYVAGAGVGAEAPPPRRPRPLEVPTPTSDLHLVRAGIATVVVAAGYRPDYPWLRLPITTADGAIRQYRGVTPAEGVYVVGQRFQHRRDSGFIHGARHDAQYVVRHLLTRSAGAPHHADTGEPAA